MQTLPSTNFPPLGTLLRATWQRFSQLAPRLIALAFVGWAATFLITAVINLPYALESAREPLGTFFGQNAAQPTNVQGGAQLVVQLVIDSLITLGMIFVLQNPSVPWKRLWQQGVPMVVPFILLQALITVGVSLGFFLFILPGALLFMLVFLAPYILVLEHYSLLGALRESARRALRVYGKLLLYALAVYVIAGVGLAATGSTPYLTTILRYALLTPLLTVLFYEVYRATRTSRSTA